MLLPPGVANAATAAAVQDASAAYAGAERARRRSQDALQDSLALYDTIVASVALAGGWWPTSPRASHETSPRASSAEER